jgi:hypothetical protein
MACQQGGGHLHESLGRVADLAGGKRHVQPRRHPVAARKAHDGPAQVADMAGDEQFGCDKSRNQADRPHQRGKGGGGQHGQA